MTTTTAGPGSPEVDAYLAGQPEKTRRALEELRALIRQAAPGVIEAFAGQLADYKFSKGAIQFPLDRPIPAELVLEMVKFRLRQVSGT